MSLFFVGKLEVSDYQGNIAALFSGVFLGCTSCSETPRAGGNAGHGGNAERGTRKRGIVYITVLCN
jgi:hypothetical protein